MNRTLLRVVFLSGLVFLVCLVQNSGSNTYYYMQPYPNERTQFPSEEQVFLMAARQNPWMGADAISGLVLAVSALLGVASLIGKRMKKRKFEREVT